MNNYLYQEAVKDAVKDKFKGRKVLQSKTTPRHPMSAERELKRVASSYMKLYNAELKQILPPLMKEYKLVRTDGVRMDDISDLARKARDKFLEAAAKLERKAATFGLEKKLEKVAKQAQQSSLRDWKRIVKQTLGVDIMESYYNEAFYDAVLKKWIADNVSKIKSIQSESLGNVEQIILKGYDQQKTIGTITKELQEEYNLSKSKAKAIARDQMGTLSGQISKLQQTDAGITKYRWSSSNDERVRDCHREFNGKVFEWDNPPEEWYDTKSRGRVYTGNRFHPGEAYGCRCVPIPIFPWENLDLPINGKDLKDEQQSSQGF